MQGIYIHIPFCKSRCIYCDFYSTTLLHLREKYVRNLCHEMDLRHTYLPDEEYSTVYIGGGTPSQLTPDQIDTVISHLYATFHISPDAEFTIEMNPDDITPESIRHLKGLPVNRISMGIQTFSDRRLSFLHRRHSAQQAIDAVRLCQDNGFTNISIDLMFGFPDETLDDWKSDVSEALSLHVPHISAYSLMYEEGTTLTRMLTEGKIQEIPDELSRQMYDHLCDTLHDNGYEHYEISNFCFPGYHSRHNSSYWESIPYIGLGAGAHSFNGDSRQWNSRMENGNWSVEDREVLTPVQKYNELIMTRLRTSKGISLDNLENYFGEYFSKVRSLLERHLADNNLHIDKDTNYLALTRKGIYISNLVISDLMISEE